MGSTPDFVSLDGVDVDDLGLNLTRLPAVFAAPADGYPSIGIPFRPGVTLTTDQPNTSAREILVQALVMDTSAANAETTMQALKDAVSGRLVGIGFDHASGRKYYGVCTDVTGDMAFPDALPGHVSTTLRFLCPDPYAVDDALTTVSGIAAERVQVTVGTGPTYPIITITGAATTPTITLRTHDGESVATMTAANIAAGDCWRVDTLHGLSEICVSGSWSSNIAALTAGFKFPVILPRYAGRSLSSWPTVEVSSGTLAVAYARRWA